MLVYARSLQDWKRNTVARSAASDADFWNPDADPRGEWRRSDLTAAKPYAEGRYEVLGPHGDTFSPRGNRWWSISRDTFEELTAQRVLAGEKAWIASCPTCGTVPTRLVVCPHNHVACSRCGHSCSVCGGGFCREHGTRACHVDGKPACSEHQRTCPSCRKDHCSTHEGTCTESGHAACTTCLTPCAHCGRVICAKHATDTRAESPRGARRLCSTCVRHCEGGSGEVVGPDEVTGCASCRRVVCARHQSTCALDGQVHCSSHLRRVDRSGRLVCEKHRGGGSYEPNAVFASDEVFACSSCGRTACNEHLGTCIVDAKLHCRSHLMLVQDVKGALACDAHRSTCHVDGALFSNAGTSEYEILGIRWRSAWRRREAGQAMEDITRRATRACRARLGLDQASGRCRPARRG